MIVRIKPWDEAVKAALADNEDLYVREDSIFGIVKECGVWGETVSGHKDSKYFYGEDNFSYPLCVVDEIKPDVLEYDILRYGKVITDDDLLVSDYDAHEHIRIRLIEFDRYLWYHKMVDGEVVNCHSVGKADV